MTEYYCPVDGCDYGAEGGKTFAGARAHISASSDSEHDWQALKQDVQEQDDKGGAEESGELDQKQVEESTNGESGSDVDEYEEQLNDARQPDSIEDPEPETDDGEATEGNGSGGPGLAMIAGTAAVALAVILKGRSDSGPTTATEQQPEESTDDSSDMTPTTLR